MKYEWQTERECLIMPCKQYIKSGISTQETVALSSVGADLIAVVKCSCDTIGILQLAED